MLSCLCAFCFQEVSFCGGCSPYGLALVKTFDALISFVGRDNVTRRFRRRQLRRAYARCRGKPLPLKGAPPHSASAPTTFAPRAQASWLAAAPPLAAFSRKPLKGARLTCAYRPGSSGERYRLKPMIICAVWASPSALVLYGVFPLAPSLSILACRGEFPEPPG